MKSAQLKDFLNETKIQTIGELIENIDAVIEVTRDDVLRIARKNRWIFFDFDSVFGESAKVVKKTLKKTKLSAVKRILSCEDVNQATNWLIARLFNNAKNLVLSERYKNNLNGISVSYDIDKIYEEDTTQEEIEREDLLNKLDNDIIKYGLKKAFNNGMDGDLDFDEVETLCLKFGFDIIEVLGYDPEKAPELGVETTKNGHKQVVLIF